MVIKALCWKKSDRMITGSTSNQSAPFRSLMCLDCSCLSHRLSHPCFSTIRLKIEEIHTLTMFSLWFVFFEYSVYLICFVSLFVRPNDWHWRTSESTNMSSEGEFASCFYYQLGTFAVTTDMYNINVSHEHLAFWHLTSWKEYKYL